MNNKTIDELSSETFPNEIETAIEKSRKNMDAYITQMNQIAEELSSIEQSILQEEQNYSQLFAQKDLLANSKVQMDEKTISELTEISNQFAQFKDLSMQKHYDPEQSSHKGGCAWNSCWTCSSNCGGICSSQCGSTCGKSCGSVSSHMQGGD